jgi:hypothetical protein
VTLYFNGVSADELGSSQSLVHTLLAVSKTVGKIGYEADVQNLCNASGLSYQKLHEELEELKVTKSRLNWIVNQTHF